MEKRYFSPRDIDVLIPMLEQIFDSIAACKAQAETLAGKMLDRRSSPATVDVVEGQLARSQMEFLSEAVQDYLQHIQELGGVAKDIEAGLVDFLGELDGREVWFCWKRGERKVSYWHPLEGGYAQRKILPHLTPNTTLH